MTRVAPLPIPWHSVGVGPLRRLCAALLAVVSMVWLAGDVAARADAVRAHVVCAEHGERMHAAPTGEHCTQLDLHADRTGHSHQDCQLAGAGPAPALGGLAAPTSLDFVPSPPGFPGVEAASAFSPAPLSFAPKTSPPVA